MSRGHAQLLLAAVLVLIVAVASLVLVATLG
jgi:hypothetical protein